MSKMADLDIQIREMLEEGLRPFSIASILGVPLEWVYNVMGQEDDFDYPDGVEDHDYTVTGCDADEYDESMDGDFDSAMASAGFGTDEDYGYYGDE